MMLTAYQAKSLRNVVVRQLFEAGVFVVDAVAADRRTVELRRCGAPYGSLTTVPVSSLSSISFAGSFVPADEWIKLH